MPAAASLQRSSRFDEEEPDQGLKQAALVTVLPGEAGALPFSPSNRPTNLFCKLSSVWIPLL